MGFANVSTRDLADDAGLSRSHIYHYFADWNELRREAFLRFANAQLQEVGALVAGMQPDDALRAFLRNCLPAKGDDAWVLWLDAWDEAMHDPALAKTYQAVDEQWQQMLATLIDHGVEAGVFRCSSSRRAARQLFFLAIGYANDLMLRQSDQAAAEAEAELMEVADLLLGTHPAPA
ncbi:TetR family transcriptional regulator [Jeongeupia sp. USM3]|nr:TetR family transcriptional regulator [Jeongeupia sp. USM3]